nr:hypothetical protein [Tanacetum cinerariifolium]
TKTKGECQKEKKGGSASSTTPSTPIATPTPTTTVMAAPRLSAAAKGVPDVPSDDSEEELSWNSSDDEDIGKQEATESDEGDDEVTKSEDEETREQEEESFDLIPQTPEDTSQLPTPPTPIPSLDLQSLPTFALVFRFEDRVKLLEVNFFNIPGNKSIQRSDEQRNLYKALVKAYDADKTILDTYGESAILKRRREDSVA